jgi:hypothetical protein
MADPFPVVWTQTTVDTDPHRTRWSQLKRTFGQPVALLRARREAIRKRAQEIYQERLARGIEGTALGDWLQAEEELGSQ